MKTEISKNKLFLQQEYEENTFCNYDFADHIDANFDSRKIGMGKNQTGRKEYNQKFGGTYKKMAFYQKRSHS